MTEQPGQEAGTVWAKGPEDLDWPALRRYLASKGIMLDLSEPPKRCAGGLANLNFEVIVDNQRAILRRAPHGPLPKGAHDMVREHRVLSRLPAAFPLAPRSFHLCKDPAVLGAPFQLIEFRPGRVLRGDDPGTLAPCEDLPGGLCTLFSDTMARLHSVDPNRCDLSDLSRPAGFASRNAARWSNAAIDICAGTEDAKLADEVAGQVATLFEGWNDAAPAILHCDIKLDNLILAENKLAPVALLDWDMATLGEPLFDLATLLSYWTEPGDPEVMHQLGQMPTGQPGYPSRAEMAVAYAEATGRSLDRLPQLRALCQLKLAVVFLQLHARWRDGALGDARYAGFGDLGIGLLRHARDVAAGRSD
ncbi:phosphotransferase family protein [Roseovarius sp.]|uniref:phosphotransferase family protein n=1 Tax=Roseovarius sp. TaxID=1486281 RepID=UPI003A97B959